MGQPERAQAIAFQGGEIVAVGLAGSCPGVYQRSSRITAPSGLRPPCLLGAVSVPGSLG